jgi:hypothetical protein
MHFVFPAASKLSAKPVRISLYPKYASRYLTTSNIGHSTLPSTCPVCEHSPVAAADCKPNKSLRTTIKVFLRTEEKKREALRLKDDRNCSTSEEAIVVAPSLVEDIPTAEDTRKTESAVVDVETGASQSLEQVDEAFATVEELEVQKDVPKQSIEVG